MSRGNHIARIAVKQFVLACCTCGKLVVKLKFSSGSTLWKLSTEAIAVAVRAFRAFRALCCL